MALVQVFDSKYFDYVALATDVVDNKITGATKIGGIVYLSDTAVYRIITSDFTLVAFKQPVVA